LTTLKRHDATAEIWQETYLSAILRAILYSDDPTYFLEAYRRLEPISTPDAEMRFLQTTESLFMKGATFFPKPALLRSRDTHNAVPRVAGWVGP
jgi:ChAPs (Chs5p-Arf1p-binding proteins)